MMMQFKSKADKAIACGILALVAGVLFLYGSTKVRFASPDLEYDVFTDYDSCVTNNTVRFSFSTFGLPSSAEVYLDYRPEGSTNDADWVTLAHSTLADFPNPAEFTFPDATNYEWLVYTAWTPGPAVHTNGVWQTDWTSAARQDAPDALSVVPIRAEVVVE